MKTFANVVISEMLNYVRAGILGRLIGCKPVTSLVA
jgi:hypothetical protein